MARRENTSDLMDRVLAPAFVALARYIPPSVTPNQVTLVSGLCGLASAFVLMLWSSGGAYWLASVLILLYSFLDNMDGVHARRTGRANRLGGFVDHAFDAAITPLTYLALVLRFDLAHPLFLSVVYLRSVSNAVAANSEVATGKLFIPALGPTVESYLTMALLLSFFFVPGPQGHGAVWFMLDLSWAGFSVSNSALPFTVLTAFFLISLFGNLLGMLDIVKFTFRNHH